MREDEIVKQGNGKFFQNIKTNKQGWSRKIQNELKGIKNGTKVIENKDQNKRNN